jgi:hypothetical protein
VFILAWLRDGTDIARLGAGFGMSRATAYRRHREALDVIAAQAPTLTEALTQAVHDRLSYLLLPESSKIVIIKAWAGQTSSARTQNLSCPWGPLGGHTRCAVRNGLRPSARHERRAEEE